MARAWTLPSYLYQREVRLGKSVSLERSGGQWRSEAEEADEDWDGILEYDSSSSEDLDDESFSTNNEEADDDVGGIPSLDREATFCLERFHISEELFASIAESSRFNYSELLKKLQDDSNMIAIIKWTFRINLAIGDHGVLLEFVWI